MKRLIIIKKKLKSRVQNDIIHLLHRTNKFKTFESPYAKWLMILNYLEVVKLSLIETTHKNYDNMIF